MLLAVKMKVYSMSNSPLPTAYELLPIEYEASASVGCICMCQKHKRSYMANTRTKLCDAIFEILTTRAASAVTN